MGAQQDHADRQPVLTVGRYSLFGEIAKGGMATVHFGRMSSVGGFVRIVAIKRMRRDIALDPEFVAMFLDEARLAARVEHPNVVSTIDVVAEAGEVFLVMEYVRGETIGKLARAARNRQESVPIPIALSVFCGALGGLHAAHEALGEGGVPLGIIHRDVSPQNILVGEDGVARITDFGIAKAESRLQVTQDGKMKGKLGYIAPEQFDRTSGKPVDRRVDIFTAATVLWEVLAGRSLFLGDHPAETIANILTATVQPLPEIRSDVSAVLDRLVRRALARNPAQRPQTAAEFAMALEQCAETGIASPRAVGAWVRSLAGQVLEDRLKYIRDIESGAALTPDSGAREIIAVAARRSAKTVDEGIRASPPSPSNQSFASNGPLPIEAQAPNPPDNTEPTCAETVDLAQIEVEPKRVPARLIFMAVGLGATVAIGALALWLAIGGWLQSSRAAVSASVAGADSAPAQVESAKPIAPAIDSVIEPVAPPSPSSTVRGSPAHPLPSPPATSKTKKPQTYLPDRP
jgi:eukaryotic-like serine/threonine-protein kinase